MIAPKTCTCGEAMQWRSRVKIQYLGRGPGGAYVCHHCDEPCAGVATTARCPLCARIAIKR